MDSSSLIVVAAVFLVYAALSRRLQGTSVTAPIVFVVAGFLFGAEGLGWLHVTLGQDAVSALAEATLVVVLFTDASRIDLPALRNEYSVPARLLGIGLPLTIVVGTLVGGLVLGSVSWAEALVLAIVLAPTDAALGQAVVTDEHLPSRIRQGLNVESGLNDGLCVPLLAIALAVAQTDAGDTTATHAARLVCEAIGWGIVGGVVAGVVAGCVLQAARSRGWIEARWIAVVPVIAAVGAFGIADSRGGSGFIAAFVGGAVFGRIAGREADSAAFSEELGSVLNGVTLIVFGAAVLGSVWSEIGLVDVGYAVLSLTLVRMVPVAIAMLGSRAAPTHGALPGMVRAARPRVDRVRRRRRRGVRSPAHLRPHRRAHRDGRAQCRRARHHCGAVGAPLCRVAHPVVVADGEHPRAPSTLAPPRPLART